MPGTSRSPSPPLTDPLAEARSLGIQNFSEVERPYGAYHYTIEYSGSEAASHSQTQVPVCCEAHRECEDSHWGTLRKAWDSFVSHQIRIPCPVSLLPTSRKNLLVFRAFGVDDCKERIAELQPANMYWVSKWTTMIARLLCAQAPQWVRLMWPLPAQASRETRWINDNEWPLLQTGCCV